MAASSVLVWPIFQTIESHEKGSELWLENRGATPVNLQLRVFSWTKKGRPMPMPISVTSSPAHLLPPSRPASVSWYG
ncbi:hypothetical protein [Klebsiella oxytoca]